MEFLFVFKLKPRLNNSPSIYPLNIINHQSSFHGIAIIVCLCSTAVLIIISPNFIPGYGICPETFVYYKMIPISIMSCTFVKIIKQLSHYWLNGILFHSPV